MTAPRDEETSTAAASPAQAGSGLSGMAIRRSDVGSIPDRPVAAGVVVVVPAAAIAAFWKAAGLPAAGPPTPGKAELTVDPRTLPDGAEVAPIVAGRFASKVRDDGVLLCLADDLPGDRQGSPHRVNGCARYDAAASGSRRVRLSTGYGGVMVQPA